MARVSSLPLLTDADLSSYHSFDTDGTDNSPQSNDLSITGADFVQAKYSNGLRIDDIGEFAIKSSGVTNMPSAFGDFTISFWAQRIGTFTGGSNLSSLLLLGSAGSGTVRIAKGPSDNEVLLNTEGFGILSLSTPIVITTDVSHYAFVRSNSGATVKTYKNGVLITTDTITPRTFTLPTLMSINNNNPLDWNVILDEFVIAKKALTQAEILQQVNDGSQVVFFGM